ncbi:TIGR02680 family protein [Streptomyces sp. NPDC087440]|uniref:TIGR02680 family protein n=1 Tax=Streptomyces sp. NPDC087440 TaxID=3365790 RepID=UPI00382B3342
MFPAQDTHEAPASSVLPVPGRTRWQPLRIGLVDLFYYDDEEFWFRDGRLLLRGNNGTGKSKVLALTLPFLLDGDLSSRRVEPDGDPLKRMEWNLLLGGEHPHPERLGYTWIEFGRRDENTGQAHFRTLVCGLKAVTGRGIARHWYAVTDQRVTVDLSLLDATGTALSRDRLVEAVEGRGMVFDQAKAYRRAVDEALFGLGEQRYAALVDLLVQLRQPQLSKRPNEAALSRALTESLPPMDQAVIADVAEAFRSLDEEKEELRAASEAERAATAFLEHYRRYARVASRRRARLPRTEHSRYENLHRDLTVAQGQRLDAEQARSQAAEQLAVLEETATRLRAEDTALRAGPEMRSARELEQASADVSRTEGELTRAEGDRQQAAQAHTRALGRLGAAENRLRSAEDALAETLARAAEVSRRARLDGELRTDGAPPAELRRMSGEAVARRRRTVDHVEELAGRARLAAAERTAAAQRLDEAQAEVVATGAQQAEAAETVAEAGVRLVEGVREHLDGCTELRVADPEGLLDRLQDWTPLLSGPNPARAEASAAHRELSASLADEAASWTRAGTELRERKAAADAEMATLEAGGQRGPKAPHTRGRDVRETAAGAPLWRLVDFHETVSAAERAGLEAALEASGLLDAWVRPDGTVLGAAWRGAADAVRHDVLLAPDSGPVAGPSLAWALRPAVDRGDPRASAVGEAVVAGLLEAIGLDEGAGTDVDAGTGEDVGPATGVAGVGTGLSGNGRTWVAADGRFRVGALSGSWAKPAAEYVGEGAREVARRARIAGLRAELDSVGVELAHATAAHAAVSARRRTLDAELGSVPDDAELRQAHAQVTAAQQAARRSAERHDLLSGRLADAVRAAGYAETELIGAAKDLGLPHDRPGLLAVRSALAEYDVVLATLWPTLRERTESVAGVTTEREETEAAALRVREFAQRAEAASHASVAANSRYDTLRSTVGAAVEELERRLTATAEALRACEGEQQRTSDAHTVADRDLVRAETRIEELEKNVAEAVATRTEAIGALQRFAGTGLLAVALPELAVPAPNGELWAATPAIALARSVEAELAAVDDSEGAWERVQRHLSEEYKKLQDSLSRHGHTASARMVEDGMLVDIVYQGRERAVPELAEALTVEVGELQRILSAHEREILETHLLTEVAGTLQELIGAAERQVARMNRELEERPTSTGMKLRLVWRPSRRAPAGLAQARTQLRQSADAWSVEDRSAVGEFLQAQIAQQQTDDGAGSWLDHLTSALDYRSWHEFGIERHQHGNWVPATGPASGGERVLAVSVPLFAAASSHYATAASPYAPRLVTLDEAFAGVDDDSRAKCLGLLHAFDLDVVMTSEREWACYPQVPGIAIAQLSRVDEVAAVLVTRWEWDGTHRTRGAEPDLTAGHMPEGPAGPEVGPEAGRQLGRETW